MLKSSQDISCSAEVILCLPLFFIDIIRQNKWIGQMCMKNATALIMLDVLDLIRTEGN